MGAARIEVAPAGNSNDNAKLVRFSEAVLTIAPKATGEPVVIQESGDTVVKAFAEAGIWALLSISLLLFIVLRRVSDVLLTLIPLALAGVVTLEITVLTGMPLEFCQYHRLAASSRRRGRLQDLFHHGLARGRDKSVGNEPHAGRGFQRHDDGDRIRKSLALQIPGDIQHGETAGLVFGVHLGRGCFVSAGSDGAAPEGGAGGGRINRRLHEAGAALGVDSKEKSAFDPSPIRPILAAWPKLLPHARMPRPQSRAARGHAARRTSRGLAQSGAEPAPAWRFRGSGGL